MKLFVVVCGSSYEGYSEPVGVYSSKENAEAAVKRVMKRKGYDCIDIFQYDLDRDADE